MAAYLCAALIGLVFLATGILKAIDARSFSRQVGDYLRIQVMTQRAVVQGFVGFEFALGTALLVDLSRLFLLAAIGVLVALTALTIWASATKRTEDCGCYGGALRITPLQSALLNAVYALLLGISWYLRRGPFDMASNFPIWKIGFVLAAGIVGVTLARRSLKIGPLMDVSLLKPGRRWRAGWLPKGAVQLQNGAHLVVFLSRDCPYCKQWIPLLNVVHVQPDMPQVLGVMSLSGSDKEEFLRQHMIRFPIATAFERMTSLLADAYPTAALVEGGLIREKWIGEFPKAYLEHVRNFYASIAALSSSTATAGPAFTG